ARLDALPPQAGRKSDGGTQPSAEATGDGQHQVGERGQRCVRCLRTAHAASFGGRKSDAARDSPTRQRASAQEDSRIGAGLGRETGRTPSFFVGAPAAPTPSGG